MISLPFFALAALSLWQHFRRPRKRPFTGCAVERIVMWIGPQGMTRP